MHLVRLDLVLGEQLYAQDVVQRQADWKVSFYFVIS